MAIFLNHPNKELIIYSYFIDFESHHDYHNLQKVKIVEIQESSLPSKKLAYQGQEPQCFYKTS